MRPAPLRTLLILATLASSSAARAQDQEPTAPVETDEPVQTPEDAEPTTLEALIAARDYYQSTLRRHLPQRAGRLVGEALDLATLALALPEMWNTIASDPILQLGWKQLKMQYKPSFRWSGYAGVLAESTTYTGLTAGGSFDIEAPLCRYLSAQADAQAFHQRGRFGVAYDTRVTGCLPWGPFALEVGVLRQHDLRVGLQSTPSLPTTRYNSQAVEIGIRSYRWLEKNWEGVVTPTDVVIRGFTSPEEDAIPETSSFQIQSTFFRYIRYRRGFVGADRIIEVLPIEVLGQQEDRVARLSATVVGISPMSFRGAHIGDELYLDGRISLLQGRISDLDAPDEPLENRFHFGMSAAVHRGNERVQTSLRYQRRVIPDSEFRLLAEDRLDGVLQMLEGIPPVERQRLCRLHPPKGRPGRHRPTARLRQLRGGRQLWSRARRAVLSALQCRRRAVVLRISKRCPATQSRV